MPVKNIVLTCLRFITNWNKVEINKLDDRRVEKFMDEINV